MFDSRPSTLHRSVPWATSWSKVIAVMTTGFLRNWVMVFSGSLPGIRPVRRFEAYTTWRQQGAVVLDHAHQGADFIGVLFSSSCERFRLAISFSV